MLKFSAHHDAAHYFGRVAPPRSFGLQMWAPLCTVIRAVGKSRTSLRKHWRENNRAATHALRHRENVPPMSYLRVSYYHSILLVFFISALTSFSYLIFLSCSPHRQGSSLSLTIIIPPSPTLGRFSPPSREFASELPHGKGRRDYIESPKCGASVSNVGYPSKPNGFSAGDEAAVVGVLHLFRFPAGHSPDRREYFLGC